MKDIFRIERSGLFDPSFYLENNPDLRDLKNPIRHFVTSGCFERRNPNILFDIEFYLRTNPEIDPSKQNPLVHFIERGWKDNRNPHALFDILYFLRHRKDSKALLKGNPLAEFLHQAPSLGVAHHPLFDSRYYVEQVQESLNGQPPIVHYLLKGSREGIKPHPLFDPTYYRERYKDVKLAGTEPLTHYVIQGAQDGRKCHLLFDTKYYRRNNHEICHSDENALEHFCESNCANNANTSIFFDTSFYKAKYGHAIENGMNPLIHYVRFGAAKGYCPHPLFDPDYYLAQRADKSIARENALAHYLEVGHKLNLNPHPLFNSHFYAMNNYEVRRLGMSGLEYYLRHGAELGHSTTPLYDDEYYRKIGGADISPDTPAFFHYLKVGSQKRLSPGPKFNSQMYASRHGLEADIDPLEHFLRQIPTAPTTAPSAKDALVNTAVVSIVILSENNSHHVSACLDAVWRNTSGYEYEVIVVDNGSEENHLQTLHNHACFFQLIRLGVNRGRGEACNIGAEASTSNYVVFLDADTVVQSGWLEPLVRTLETQSDVGAVGPKVILADWTVQQAGCEVDLNSMRPLHKGLSDLDAHVNKEEKVGCVSLTTLAVRRKDFLDVFGFDTTYDPIFFEDADFCLKLNSKGLRSVYVPASLVVHYDLCRSESEATDELLIERNHTFFAHRWQALFSADKGNMSFEPPRPGNVCLDTSHQSSESHVAIYTPFPLVKGGGEKFILNLANIMQGDFPATLISDHPWSRCRLQQLSNSLGVGIHDFKLDTYNNLTESRFEPDLFFALGNSLFPPVRALGKSSFYICQFPFPEEESITADARSWLYEYSAVLFYSNFVRNHFLALLSSQGLPPIRGFVLNPPIESISGKTRKDKRILNVARFFVGGHEKKQLELVRVFRDLFSSGSLPGWELHLVGSVNNQPSSNEYFLKVKRESEGFPIFLHPEVGEDELRDLYRSSAIYWHATGLDADVISEPWAQEHFGTSIVEAMGAGCIPIVLGTGGPKEIVQNKINGFHYANTQELKEITLLLTNQFGTSYLDGIRSAAQKRAEDFSFNNFCKTIDGILRG